MAPRFLSHAAILALALAGSFLFGRPANAQEGARDYVCAFLYEHASRTFFVGRQVVEVRSRFQFNSALDRAVNTQFSTRVHGLISRDDLLAYHPGGYANWGLPQSVQRKSLAEAKRDCLEVIAQARLDGFSLYGVGAPIYQGTDDEQTTTHGFLSVLEFPNYMAGTIAARKRSGERESGGRAASTRDADGWAPGEYARYFVETVDRGQRIVEEADSLYYEQEYAAARAKYSSLFNIGVPEWQQFHPYAQEQIDRIDDVMAVAAYSSFTETTGLSFGLFGGQSYFERDGGLIGFSVSKRTFGLSAFYGVASSSEVINSLISPEGTDDGSFGEYTQYQLTAGTAIPKLRAGPVGVHAAYSFHQTDHRALHLGTLGLHVGEFGTGLVMYAHVTPVFGKPQFGLGIDLNFADR